MAPRILLTGFKPFGPHSENPSETVVRRLAAAPPAGADLTTVVLPVDYARGFDAIRAALESAPYDAALLLGLAANRPSLAFERFALNWRGGPLADTAGVQIDGEPVDAEGPAAYLSSLPVDVLVSAVRAAGVACEASSHAGTFLCNEVLYRTLRHADRNGLAVRAVFLHLPEPARPGVGAAPTAALTIDDLERGVRAALARIARLPRVGARARARRTAPARPG